MYKYQLVIFLLLASAQAFGQEPEETTAEEPTEQTGDSADQASEAQTTPNGDGIEQPKSMSGMSILGNEEAPKALVIIPWKSSELGDDISLSDTLDDRAKPVDKEVFLRELSFYEIRAAE